jgi:hypothetical protein
MKRMLIIAFALVLAGGAYWGYKYTKFHSLLARQAQAQAQRLAIKPRNFNATDDPDAAIPLRAEHPSSVQDEKNLKGRTLWVSAGGQMDFYPFNGKSVDVFHPAGVLLGAEKIVVRDAIEQAVPRWAGNRFPDADADVMLIIVRPDDGKNPTREYGVAVGDREGHDYTVLTDQLFFYDDPHQLYAHWGPKVWKAIDDHAAVLGMTERQLQLALGTVNTPRGDMMGDRSVEFNDQGKPKLVTFVNGKASEIRDETR